MTKHNAALHADRAWACSYCQNFYATKKLMLRHTQTFHQVQLGAFHPIKLPEDHRQCVAMQSKRIIDTELRLCDLQGRYYQTHRGKNLV